MTALPTTAWSPCKRSAEGRRSVATAGRAATAARTFGFRPGLIGRRAVIGLIKPAAFENQAGTAAEQAFHLTGAGFHRAILELGIVHPLEHFEAVTAGLAFVVVTRHGRSIARR